MNAVSEVVMPEPLVITENAAAKVRQLQALIDQGLADEFLDEQLLLDELESVCELADYHAIIRRQQGYDHSYYFVSTFIDDHLRFHAQHLGL